MKLYVMRVRDWKPVPVMGPDPEMAAIQGVRTHGINKPERIRLANQGRISVAPGKTFVLPTVPETFVCQAVDDVPDAAAPCDPLFWLMSLDRLPLHRLMKQVWRGGMMVECGKPAVAQMFENLATGLRRAASQMREPTRLQAVYLLRLTMEVDLDIRSIAAERPAGRVPGEKAYNLIYDYTDKRKQRFIELHTPNIGSELARQLAASPGFDWGRLKYNEAKQVRRLLRAYGYTETELDMSEIDALFHDGPKGLKLRRRQMDLGMPDLLENHEVLRLTDF